MGGNGKEFIGNHGIKGCHAEGGFAYYGVENDEKNLHRSFLVIPFHRPNGYDCGRASNLNQLINVADIIDYYGYNNISKYFVYLSRF